MNKEEILEEILPDLRKLHQKSLNRQYITYGSFRRLLEKAIDLAFEEKDKIFDDHSPQNQAVSVRSRTEDVPEETHGQVKDSVSKPSGTQDQNGEEEK